MRKHPMQPVVVDEHGVHRFKENAIVNFLLRAGPYDMNKLAMMSFSDEDREQFAQLIGYSVSGACDLSYVSDRIAERALRESKRLLKTHTGHPHQHGGGGAALP